MPLFYHQIFTVPHSDRSKKTLASALGSLMQNLKNIRNDPPREVRGRLRTRNLTNSYLGRVICSSNVFRLFSKNICRRQNGRLPVPCGDFFPFSATGQIAVQILIMRTCSNLSLLYLGATCIDLSVEQIH